MHNILITGSKGFIGKNLLKQLEHYEDMNILEFNRDDTNEDLHKMIQKSDFIFHLAGEVRPNSSDEQFKKSNTTLTETIIEILEKLNKKIQILMTSTIHAKLLQNEYGKTKRESEVLIENYSKRNDIECFIYRLPHVFGEDCKPNYNSVVSTWINNSIRDLEIKVFDRNISMHYVYVQDIVNEFVDSLKNEMDKELYLEPKKIYDTTLGEVVDYINEFKENINNYKYVISDNDFKTKLFETYKDYYKKLEVE